MKNFKFFKLVLLVISIALSMTFITSCGGGSDDDDNKPQGNDGIDLFNAAILATNPDEITGTVVMTASFGTMTMEYEATLEDDGSFILEYSYDRFNSYGEGGSDTATKVTGMVTYENGTYRGDTDAAKIPTNAVASKINLKSDKISAKVSNDGKVLAATVKAADTLGVLGVEYASDVTISMTMQNAKIASLTLTYTYEGANVTVLCNYN